MSQEFDTTGISMPSNEVIVKSLAGALALANGIKSSLRQWREFTDAILHIVEQHSELCLRFAATNKDPQSHMASIIINLMEKSRGDLKVMQNCSRILTILLERGQDWEQRTQLYQLLHSAGKMPALTAVLGSMAAWTTPNREGGST